jgi:hypothetical protein
MRRKFEYDPIMLDLNTYTETKKGKDKKYHPLKNRHILEKNPACDFGEYYRGHDYLFVSREKDRVVFMFAPSDDIKDWLNNLEGVFDDEGIHKGFNDSFKKFTSIVKAELANVGNRTIQFIGTSRGGAICQIGAKLSGELGYPTHCMHFEAPMVFNKEVRNKLELLPIHCTAVMQVHSYVPALPPHIMGFRRWGRRKVLRPKWWYMFPGTFIKIHLDCNSNIERYTYESK